MKPLPTGTITFLFTDIEGSTKLWEAQPEAMRFALARHDALLRKAIHDNEGVVFKTVGDAFCTAFATAPDALRAALAAQQQFHTEVWPPSLTLKVRMALHTGTAEARENDYFGQPLNRIARLLAVGYGGQTILSNVTSDLLRDSLPHQTTLKDMGAHRLKDLARPEHIFQLVHPTLPGEFPPLKSLDNMALPNNLPQQVTSFIGREKELAEVQTRLSRSRLLTLTGSGGSGKSRLSLQAAADLLDQFPDGVWLVELAPLADSNLITATVASVLGVKEDVGTPILTTLAESLKTRNCLLLLDNCEHVLDVSAKLADMLIRNCPDVRILATSREGLGIAGEATYRVPSLSLPDPEQTQTAESLSHFEAVRLFVDRAVQTQPAFAVSNANAPALASICFRLDGIPLAIELAAARARSLSIEEINARLDQRFRLLTGGSRTALPRQQTLRSLIDWSYDLLNEAEKALLCRLSVFAGGWTLEGGEKVCADDLVDEFDVLDLLTSLVDKSLAVTEERDGATRYRMLETVRQYARDRLLEGGEGDTWREKHLAFFLALAEEAEPHLDAARDVLWYDRLEAEHDNLRAALDFSAASVEARTNGAARPALSGLRLTRALGWFWWSRFPGEGREQMTRALRGSDAAFLEAARSGTDPNSVLLTVARVLLFYCRVIAQLGDVARTQAIAEEALALARQCACYHSICDALIQLGACAWNTRDFPRAHSLLDEAMDAASRTGDKLDAAIVLIHRGIAAERQGNRAEAKEHNSAALALSRETGNKVVFSIALNNLALTFSAMGDTRQARTMWEESLTLCRAMRNDPVTAAVLGNLGGIALDEGDCALAETYLKEAERLYCRLGVKSGMMHSLARLGSVAFRQKRYAEAGAHYRESLNIANEMQAPMLLRLMAAVRARGESAGAGDPRRAALLWGAADALSDALSLPELSPKEQSEDEAERAACRENLGEAAFEAAYKEGRLLTREQAIALAIAQAMKDATQAHD